MQNSIDNRRVVAERHKEILRRAAILRVVKVRELSDDLGVHEMTIRRDLDRLAEDGLLERVHGGAQIAQQASHEMDYRFRESHQAEAKRLIAQAALDFIHDGDTIALDPSTSAMALARLLTTRSVGAIVTSLETAVELAAGDVPLIVVGGTFDQPSRSFVGPLATQMLINLHPDKVFFSAKGFTPAAGFTDPNLAEAEASRALIRTAAMKVALMDHTKIGNVALCSLVAAEEVDVVITDRQPEPVVTDAFSRAGVQLVVARLVEREEG